MYHFFNCNKEMRLFKVLTRFIRFLFSFRDNKYKQRLQRKISINIFIRCLFLVTIVTSGIFIVNLTVRKIYKTSWPIFFFF